MPPAMRGPLFQKLACLKSSVLVSAKAPRLPAPDLTPFVILCGQIELNCAQVRQAARRGEFVSAYRSFLKALRYMDTLCFLTEERAK